MKKLLFILALAFCLIFALTSCTKDEILGSYNNVIQAAGDIQLTSDWSLEGKRKYGVDANYKDFSGTEYTFGGTSIDREAGNEIEITCKLDITDGTAKLRVYRLH